MRVLVIGGGGREHAICRALGSQPGQGEIFVCPGNPGTSEFATNLTFEGSASGPSRWVALAQQHRIDLVVVGPEAPLVEGVADALNEAGILCCGPSQEAARLEGSKEFTRALAAEVGVPSPRFQVVDRIADLEVALDSWPAPPVVKADGLAAGKGVFLPADKEACRVAARGLLEGKLGDAGRKVVLEERLFGTEASLFFACHDTEAVALPHARDHKRLLDGDQGPNTGGMGAVSPNPIVTPSLEEQVRSEIVTPTLRLLSRRGCPFVGFLFVGIMLTEKGPMLLEFNVRLGDPEAQAILPRLSAGEFLRLCLATARGDLKGFSLKVQPDATCALVFSAAGYPDHPRSGDVIRIDKSGFGDHRWVVHAGTSFREGELVTSGGRVLAVVARAPTVAEATNSAYKGALGVDFEGHHYRQDIGRSG